MVDSLNVAIVGCGYIGRKRMESLGGHTLAAVGDTDLARARELARGRPGVFVSADWREVVDRADVDCVVVATTNDVLAEIALGAIRAGKHILVEKPAARHPSELALPISAARENKVAVHVGFNHRFHPALRKAREIVDSGLLGPMMFVRGRYGHGGRIGYEKEWRADPARSGGGELIDQGVHLIDLARWFLGDFSEVGGHAHTYFWDMPVEDNAFLLLRTAREQVAWLHVSWTEWKNLFSFEIYGKEGKLHVEGLGGSYGVERLACYIMLPEMGPPETTTWEFTGGDESWRLEFDSFARAIREGKEPEITLDDARAALEIVHRIYGVEKP
ncbi:Gfo/Idh/MocA family protein [Nitrospinota bacterium]